MNFHDKNIQRWTVLLYIGLAFSGVIFRFYHITENQFFYYDEGMWLNQHRGFVELIENNPPRNIRDLYNILRISAKFSLNTAKSLWAFISITRVFFAGAEGWYYLRIISAIFGSLSIGLVYLFAKKFYQSKWTALLACSIFALYPSHIFYSRLAIQEGFSTFCFLTGLYLYFFSKRMITKTLLSSFFFACVFFSNYRMIIIPILVGLSEWIVSLTDKQKFDIRRYVYNTVCFFAFVFLIGDLYNGANTYVTFAWIFHQMHAAKTVFRFSNYFSYPYYIFRLESIFFFILFFGNMVFLFKRQWNKIFPFAIACVVIGGFTLAYEKGIRYTCAVMPFMSMSAAAFLVHVFNKQKTDMRKWCVIVFVILMFAVHLTKASRIVQFHSDYETALTDLRKKKKDIKVLSTQSMVQKLFVDNNEYVKEPPLDVHSLLSLYAQGYTHLVIDPQAHISFTHDKVQVHEKLHGYLNFIVRNVRPQKVYAHFDKEMMERFVLEHNADLKRTLDFLKANDKNQYGKLKVYDLNVCVRLMQQILRQNQ